MTSDQSGVQEILREFIVESTENLQRFELALLELEADPTREEALRELFRAIHSIKGSCGFFGLSKVEIVTHAGETLLDKLRSGSLLLSPEIASTLLAMSDTVRRLLSSVDETGSEANVEVAPLVRRLEDHSGQMVPVARPSDEASGYSGALLNFEELRALATRDNKIRVDTALLERLMNLVGELVLARNQIVQSTALLQSHSVSAASQRLSLVTTEIQEVVMKTRMQPIGQVWSRFPRLVRDLAQGSGKQVRVEMEGRDTELDKSLIEAIQDPLTHLVRNAIDHGIELPVDRTREGKNPSGTLALRAFHEAGMVNIEVRDDGRGIDTEKVRRKAIARGLVTPEVAARMSDRELWAFVFAPGFSTQDEVSNISGRGVGMDVVKSNIEKIGGTVDLQSQAGSGTLVRIKIPLTLAIIPALIVTSAGDRFAIPQANLLEVVRLELSDSERRIEHIRGTAVLRLRGQILPLVYLRNELSQPPPDQQADTVSVVVLQADERAFGIVVDEINDTEEIVVKPLWAKLKGLSCYAGATVMGDGRVALILEALGLAAKVGVLREDRSLDAALSAPANETGLPIKSVQKAVVCRLGADGRVAIPLSAVSRLEEIPVERIERTGAAEVTQYRGDILRLVRVASLLEERRRRPRGSASASDAQAALPVVVYSHAGRTAGLVVDGILDIVALDDDLHREGARKGVLGSIVVSGRVTEVLDLDALISSLEPRSSDLRDPARVA